MKAQQEPEPAVKKAPEPEVKKAPEPAEPAKFADQAAVLATMPADVAALADKAAMEAYLERLKGVPGIGSAEVTQGVADGFAVKLDPATEAAEIIKNFAWVDAYAVSGDVEQKLFSVHLRKGEVEGSKGKKLVTEYPRFGPYRVEARLVERPKGKAPKLVSGASPAYKLADHAGSVQWLFFMREG